MNKYNKNLSLILFLTILLSITFISCSDDDPITSTTYKISGMVTTPNGEALVEATLSIKGNVNKSTLSDNNGNYEFTELETGDYIVSIFSTEYNFVESSFEILGLDENMTFNFKASEAYSEGVIDPNLVGTWKLTKILAPIQTTPEAVGIDLTAVFDADGTLEFTTTDAEGTTVDEGTWSTLNGNITIKIDGDEPITSPYTVNGNIASITSFTIVFNDSPITASLEFTKQ